MPSFETSAAPARDAQRRERLVVVEDDPVTRAMIAGYKSWYHRIEVRPGIITPGANDSPLNLQMLQLPADCSGMRVLDIGARDGFFSFELERPLSLKRPAPRDLEHLVVQRRHLLL